MNIHLLWHNLSLPEHSVYCRYHPVEAAFLVVDDNILYALGNGEVTDSVY